MSDRLDEAEPLMHRALAIDEQSYGADHPDVAIDLSNLAQLLQDTNRMDEAEPLSLRCVRILLGFTLRTGHEHPHQRVAFGNYESLLRAMGRSEAEVQEKIAALTASQATPAGDLVPPPHM